MALPTRIVRTGEPRCFEFGGFRLEPGTRQLLREGTPLELTPRTFDLLQALVENHHRVVEKGELLRRVWHDSIVEESNLTQQVFLLRKVLGDSPEDPRFIATVARRGYRFIGEVEEAGLPFGGNRLTVVVPAVKSTWRRRGVRTAAVAIAILVGGGVLLTRAVRRFSAPDPPTFHPLTFRRHGLDRARFTPDGRSVVLDAKWDGDTNQLFITPVSEPALRPLGLSRAQVVRVSAGGDVAVLLDDGSSSDSLTVAKVPLTGGGPRKVVEGVRNADWAPEIDQFAILRRIGGRTRVEYPVGTLLYETGGWIDALKISPGRDRVAFLEHPIMGDSRGFATVVDRQGHARSLSREWGAVFGLAWTPNGHEVWFGRFDGRIYAVGAADLSGNERDVYRGPDGLIVQDIAPDGRALATQFHVHAGIMWRPAGSTEERDLAVFHMTRASTIAAGGKTMLFTVEDQGPEWTTYATYIQTADGPGPIRLGEGSAQGLSRDGRSALAISYRKPAHLVLLPTGAGQAREIPNGSIEQFHRAQWLPDGERVVFAANEKGKGIRLYVQGIAGGVTRAITPEGYSLDPEGVSADGRFVVCLPEGGQASRCPIGDGPIEPLRGVEQGEKVVRWSEDGQSLYVYRRARFPLQVFAVDVRTGQRTPWKEIAPPDPGTLRDVLQLLTTADGRAYAYNYLRLSNELYLIEGFK